MVLSLLLTGGQGHNGVHDSGYPVSVDVKSEAAMRALAAEVGKTFRPGDVVLLHGELGAGKTTFVRGYLESLGVTEPVRSPTFNLLQVFDTNPPVMHADLYRVSSYKGIGLEEYLDTHVCFVEWPDRATGLVSQGMCWNVSFEFTPGGRKVTVVPPPASVQDP